MRRCAGRLYTGTTGLLVGVILSACASPTDAEDPSVVHVEDSSKFEAEEYVGLPLDEAMARGREAGFIVRFREPGMQATLDMNQRRITFIINNDRVVVRAERG